MIVDQIIYYRFRNCRRLVSHSILENMRKTQKYHKFLFKLRVFECQEKSVSRHRNINRRSYCMKCLICKFFDDD